MCSSEVGFDPGVRQPVERLVTGKSSRVFGCLTRDIASSFSSHDARRGLLLLRLILKSVFFYYYYCSCVRVISCWRSFFFSSSFFRIMVYLNYRIVC